MGRMSRAGYDLYTGKRSIDFIGHRGLWYTISLLVVALAVTAVVVKPLNFGVEFTGGTQFAVTVPTDEAGQAGADRMLDAVGDAGVPGAENPIVTTAGDDRIDVRVETFDVGERREVEDVIKSEFTDVTNQDISIEEIGPSWGQEVAQRALIGIAIFLTLVVLFIWFYFREWKMSVAALLALFHDIAVTVGVYALSGFQVTPAAVTGLLAILGFSLYDTVVVFDKVRENTTTLRKNTQSYADAANLAVNQTLVRSINTSIVALIPIGAILYVSAIYLGASSLQDLALAQFVGMAAGVYSSVMLAPRVLVHLKSSESEVQEQERRARAKARAIAADPYHSVPAYAEGMPIGEGQRELDEDEESDEGEAVTVAPSRDRRPNEAGKGRTQPTQSRPVTESSSSGRKQPQRKPRSQRGRK